MLAVLVITHVFVSLINDQLLTKTSVSHCVNTSDLIRIFDHCATNVSIFMFSYFVSYHNVSYIYKVCIL